MWSTCAVLLRFDIYLYPWDYVTGTGFVILLSYQNQNFGGYSLNRSLPKPQVLQQRTNRTHTTALWTYRNDIWIKTSWHWSTFGVCRITGPFIGVSTGHWRNQEVPAMRRCIVSFSVAWKIQWTNNRNVDDMWRHDAHVKSPQGHICTVGRTR